MSETVSAFNPATGLFSDTTLNATDLNTAFAVKLAGLGGGSGGSGYTLPTASTVTLGGVKIDGATILVGTGMAAGVISVGSVPYSNITGAPAIGALAALPVPAAGIVLSTGSAFTPLTIGANLTLTGSTLAGTGGGGGTYTGTAPIVVSGSVISMAANAYDAYGAAATEQTRATAAENARLVIANNLSDLASASTARTNLGLGAIATQAIPAAGVVYSTGTALEPLTLGTNLSLSGSTLNAASSGGGASFPGGSGLVSATGAQVTVSTGLSLSGNTLTATGGTIPAAGVVYSTGSVLEPLTIGSGLTLSGSTLTGAVTSVAGQTGVVTAAELVTAVFPGGATSLTSGTGAAIMLGTDLGITSGTLNVTVPTASTTVAGILKVDGTSIAVTGGIASVVATAPTAFTGTMPAASAIQLIDTADQYYTGTQLGPVLAPFGTTAGTYAQGNDTRIIGTPVAVTAAGTNQGTATALTTQFSTVTTTAAGQGVELQAVTSEQNIANALGGNALLIYPPSGATINALSANTPVTLPFGTSCTVRSTNGTAFTVTLPIDPAVVGLKAITAATSGATQSLAWPTTIGTQVYEYTLGANTTFSLATPPTGVDARIELRIKNDSAGTYSATVPTPSGGWSGESAPSPVTGANAVSVYRYAASSFGVLGSY